MSIQNHYIPRNMKTLTEKELKCYKALVHVEGWNPACCFRYLDTVKGLHILETPKTKKKITTRNNLLITRKNS